MLCYRKVGVVDAGVGAEVVAEVDTAQPEGQLHDPVVLRIEATLHHQGVG